MSRAIFKATFWLCFLALVNACGMGPAAEGPERTRTNKQPTTASSAPTSSNSVPKGKVFFPRHEEGEVPAALGGGRLILDAEGCIRLKVMEDYPAVTLIWPPNYAASTEGSEIRILDEGGRVVARVGDIVRIGGGFIGGRRALEGISGVNEQTKRKLIQRCPGEYFYASPHITPAQER